MSTAQEERQAGASDIPGKKKEEKVEEEEEEEELIVNKDEREVLLGVGPGIMLSAPPPLSLISPGISRTF